MKCPVCDNETYESVCEKCGYMLENDYTTNRFLTQLSQKEIEDYQKHLSMYRKLYHGYHEDPYQDKNIEQLLAEAYSYFRMDEHSKAFEIYSKVIEREDNITAYEWLGYLYKEGYGTSLNYGKAYDYFKKAINLGSTYGMFQLAKMYEEGLGVIKNGQRANDYYRKSANLGYVDSMFNLGYNYENGKGVIQDYKEAKKWYEKAMEHNNAGAYNNLGIMYENGQGVKKDLKKAFELYEKSASLGNKYAMYNIGLIYEYGKGKIKNNKKAKEWYQKSAKLGHEDARKRLDELK